MGAVVLGALALYLLISVGVVKWVIRYARKHEKNTKLWGFGAAFIMYNLVFWDWIPTVVVHKYYCSTEAGFWVYKTLDQWKAENPRVMETLSSPSSTGSPTKHERFDNAHGKTTAYLLNERFNWIVTQQDISSILPIIRTEQQIKDVKKNEVLARYVDFGSGNSVKNTIGPPGPLKFWLHRLNCSGGELNHGKMLQLESQIELFGNGGKK